MVGQGASPSAIPLSIHHPLDKAWSLYYLATMPARSGNGESMSDYNLEHDIYRLLREEPFFAAISRSVNKHSTRSVATAGVRISKDGYFDLYYNPEFFATLEDKQRRGVLKHEFYHLIFEHCLTRNPDSEGKFTTIWNIATDLSINCHLKDEVPEFGVFPDKMGFPEYLSAEQYVGMIEDKYGENGPGQGEGSDGQFDDHDGWGGEPNSEAEGSMAIARERLREAMRKGAEEAAKSSHGFGNMHESVREKIMQFINGTVDWRAVLRNFIGQSQRSFKSNTIKRINKRFPYIHPGRKVNRTANIAIAIDQSGSVDDSMLSLFFGELANLSKLVTFDIIPFDTEVGKDLIVTWEKGKKYTSAQRVMNGGTDFDAPTRYVNESGKYDGLIVLTDMQAPAPVPCRVRRLWVTTPDNKESPYFKTNELVIAVKNNR